MADSPRPLAGIRVLDLSDEATVFGARLLAELGADVIRVESSSGDSVRHRPPFLHGEAGIERGLAHLLYNAGKRSVALDLSTAGGMSALASVAKTCDVVIGPLGATPAIRALFDRLEANPAGPGIIDIVFRRGAPGEVATDLVATAAGGLLVLGGHPGDPPNHPAGELAYKQCSLAAAEAALALILERYQDRSAGRIVVSLQEAVNFTTIQTANANWLHWQDRIPNRHQPMTPHSIYRSRDDQWLSFTIHPPHWPRYVDWIEKALGSAGPMSDPEWADATYRAPHLSIYADYTRRLCAGLTLDELLEEGQARGLLVLPVNGVRGLAEDIHLRERGFFEAVEHPQLGESVHLPRTPFLSNAYTVTTAPAPSLGQHTVTVLGEAGMLPEEIDEYFALGAAAGPREAAPGTPLPVISQRPADWGKSGHQPLKGVRILDFCWAIAGPLGTRLLADLGADVLKVESAYRLDPIRYIGVQPKGHMSWDTLGQFNDCSPNKRAMTLNLNTPEGIDIARRLAETADVVTSNYTPHRLDRWGLGYEAVKVANPGVIYANLAVMGIRGPHDGWRSYGNGIVAMCGIGALTGFEGREPIGIGTLHTDFTVPYFAAAQVMAAIHRKRETGEGQYLELSQYESSVHLLDTELAAYLNDGAEPPRQGNRSSRMAPHGVYPSAGEDRWIAIACRDDADWARLSALTGIAGLDTLEARLADCEALEAKLSAWTRERDAWEAASALQAAGVPASPLEDLGDLMGRDAAVAASYEELALPVGVTAMVQHEPILWKGERLPLARAPLWGEHTFDVLSGELGLSADEIASLAANNVLY